MAIVCTVLAWLCKEYRLLSCTLNAYFDIAYTTERHTRLVLCKTSPLFSSPYVTQERYRATVDYVLSTLSPRVNSGVRLAAYKQRCALSPETRPAAEAV